MERSTRIVYLEYMRIVACALVIFNHSPGYTLYSVSSGIRQVFYMTLTMITRINVPLFFMVSGVLLLGKKESWRQLFKKRIIRIGGGVGSRYKSILCICIYGKLFIQGRE